MDSEIVSHGDPTVLGIDIGGAHLKYATAAGATSAIAFPLWQRPADLAAQLCQDIGSFPAIGALAVTMTGELADCFLDRCDGVQAIVLAAVEASRRLGIAEPLFYAVDGDFHDAESACRFPDRVAAANWHALAKYVATQTATAADEQPTLLVDLGSTTTDLIPIRAGRLGTTARTDFERLQEGTLVYVGGGRTPACALVDEFRFRGRSVPLMREVFATMDDARLLLGYTDPDPSDTATATADGKPRDRFHAANRMARMIGLDHRNVSLQESVELARQVHRRGVQRIAEAIQRCRQAGLLMSERTWLISGHAIDLLPAPEPGRRIIQVSNLLGDELSRSATAFAVAQLADRWRSARR